MKTILALSTFALLVSVLPGAAQTAGSLKISSPNFTAGGMIPAKYSCDADKVNPQLDFAGVPASAKSLALIIDDPDVPKTMIPSGEFVHWIVWDLAPTTKGIAEADKSASTMGLNGTGKPGYYPMCPPDKEHRYYFKLYALDKMLTGAKITNKQELLAAMQGHIVGQAEVMARYPKKK